MDYAAFTLNAFRVIRFIRALEGAGLISVACPSSTMSELTTSSALFLLRTSHKRLNM